MNKPRSVMPLNPYRGGITRTVKANYYKVSQSNFLYATQRGATGVIKIYERLHSDRDGLQPSHSEVLPWAACGGVSRAIKASVNDVCAIYAREIENDEIHIRIQQEQPCGGGRLSSTISTKSATPSAAQDERTR